ncbi:MAG TPA: hypothetical protein VMG10_19570 [Gemmataceae bacterium]|nr:hypothetical protein [Gemmataceae bacterium]
MILLDTDHLTVLKYPNSERGARLSERLRLRMPEEIVAISIVSVEEQMRGWLAAIAKERQARRQVFGYAELAGLFEYVRAFCLV